MKISDLARHSRKFILTLPLFAACTKRESPPTTAIRIPPPPVTSETAPPIPSIAPEPAHPTARLQAEPNTCQPSAIKQLDSFRAVELPGTYWIVMVREEGTSWYPQQRPSLRRHQALHLDMTNLEEFPFLEGQKGPLRFTLELRSEAVVPYRGQWLSTYDAHIRAICVPVAKN